MAFSWCHKQSSRPSQQGPAIPVTYRLPLRKKSESEDPDVVPADGEPTRRPPKGETLFAVVSDIGSLDQHRLAVVVGLPVLAKPLLRHDGLCAALHLRQAG